MSQTAGQAEVAAGNALFVEEEFQAAAQRFSSAITKLLGVEAFPALFGRGRCSMIAGEMGAATNDFQECVSLKPNHALSNFYLGLALCEHNTLESYERAYNHFLRARKSGRNDPRFKEHLARCKSRIEELKPKEEVFRPPAETTSTKPTPSRPTEEKVAQEDVVMEDVQPPVPMPTFRDTWTQSPAKITFVIYAKNFARERIHVDFEPDRVTIGLDLEDGSVYRRNIELLNPIEPEQCKWTSNKFKINIQLQKAVLGKWESLERVLDDGEEKRLNAPWTTSRDWNEVDKDAEDELSKEKPEGEQALQSLFQKIYSDADEDQRRAMIKSFQTSGGTVLSTNWDDVQGKDYEGKDAVLPTDQHVKKWEY